MNSLALGSHNFAVKSSLPLTNYTINLFYPYQFRASFLDINGVDYICVSSKLPDSLEVLSVPHEYLFV